MLRKWVLLFGVAFGLVTISTLTEPTLSASDSNEFLQAVQKDQPPQKDEPAKKDPATQKEQPATKEPSSEVNGSLVIDKQKVEYKVTTGRLPVMDMTGKAKGYIFYMAYTRKTAAKAGSRPLTFCFNGGPGSSSSYVHMGLFGPRRVLIDEDGKTIPTPYRLVENEYSMLDVTDLVFIDPVSTGFSRSDDAKNAKLFHGLEEDTHSVGEFIRSYVAKFERGASPTFIAGESYGTTRAASLSSYLQEKGGVKLVGIMLISTVLDFQTISFGANNDLPNVLFLPTYTAAALHHKKVTGDPATLLEQSERFANGPYAEALRKGKGLTSEERKSMAKTVAEYTGLSEEYVLSVNLRISDNGFRGALLRESKENIGRYDARVTGKAGGGKGGKGGGGGGDPSNALTSPAFTQCINNYLADELNCKTDLKYNVSGQVNPWSYGVPRNKATVVPRLRSAMEKDKSFRVFVACGYCDLATPYSAAKWTMAQLSPPDMQNRITLAYYDGGHMMYTIRASHKKLREDMLKFINADNVARPGPDFDLLSGRLAAPLFRASPFSQQAGGYVGNWGCN
jgi:carboxypeptidase C (cathepsin A)